MEALKYPWQLLTDPSSKARLQAVPSTPVSPRTGGALLEKTDVVENPRDTSHHKCLLMSGCDLFQMLSLQVIYAPKIFL